MFLLFIKIVFFLSITQLNHNASSYQKNKICKLIHFFINKARDEPGREFALDE